jgi:hypothetical protein
MVLPVAIEVGFEILLFWAPALALPLFPWRLLQLSERKKEVLKAFLSPSSSPHAIGLVWAELFFGLTDLLKFSICHTTTLLLGFPSRDPALTCTDNLRILYTSGARACSCCLLSASCC